MRPLVSEEELRVTENDAFAFSWEDLNVFLLLIIGIGFTLFSCGHTVLYHGDEFGLVEDLFDLSNRPFRLLISSMRVSKVCVFFKRMIQSLPSSLARGHREETVVTYCLFCGVGRARFQ